MSGTGGSGVGGATTVTAVPLGTSTLQWAKRTLFRWYVVICHVSTTQLLPQYLLVTTPQKTSNDARESPVQVSIKRTNGRPKNTKPSIAIIV